MCTGVTVDAVRVDNVEATVGVVARGLEEEATVIAAVGVVGFAVVVGGGKVGAIFTFIDW